MKLPSAVADILRVAAPTVAAALAGPFAPLAAGIVTAALRQWLPGDVAPEQKATPVEVVQAVQEHASDQKLLYDLQKAELDLLRYEQELGFRFADLEVRDREGARKTMTTLVSQGSHLGWVPGALSTIITVGFFGVCGVMLLYRIEVDQSQREALLLILGALIASFTDVRSFWLGSSVSSRNQNAALVDQAARAVDALGDAAQKAEAPATAPAPPPPIVVVPPQPPAPAPAVPEGEWRQGPHGGLRWRQTAKGVIRDGTEEPMRTVGQPATVRRIWKAYGPLIAAACAKHAVPLEIVVATIAQESGGRARAILVEPDKRMSVGLMQTLTSTAEEMLGRRLSIEDLNDPATSIEAGTAYISHQRAISEYQVPLVAAAYNAGGLHPPRTQDNNPWRLRSTGDHISRVCSFFGDSCFVAEEDGWSHAEAEKLAA